MELFCENFAGWVWGGFGVVDKKIDMRPKTIILLHFCIFSSKITGLRARAVSWTKGFFNHRKLMIPGVQAQNNMEPAMGGKVK